MPEPGLSKDDRVATKLGDLKNESFEVLVNHKLESGFVTDRISLGKTSIHICKFLGCKLIAKLEPLGLTE